MKKTLLAAALLAATSYATAATDVTLYGVLDAGVTVSKVHGGDTKVQMSNGNWMGNRWGIKGSEDLGSGNSVFFKLEQGYKLSNGNEAAEGKAFSREAALGVSGNWGTVAFGRFGGLSSDCGTYSILGGTPYTTSFQTIGSMYSAFYLTDRYDNSIVYVTPEYNGFQGSFMYSNGREGDENKWSYNQHYYGAGLTYGNGPLNFDLIYEALDYKGKEDKNKTTQLLNLGASYDVGAFKLYGAYEYAIHAPLPGFVGFDTKTEAGKKLEDKYNNGKANDYHAFALSASTNALGGEVMLQSQFAFGKNKNASEDGLEDKFNSFSVGAAYFYHFSKRTLMYTQAAWGTAGKALKHNTDDLRGWNATIGMTHTFLLFDQLEKNFQGASAPWFIFGDVIFDKTC